MKDDKTNPLLDQNFGKEYNLLEEENNRFNNSIEEINKEIDIKNLDENVIFTKLLTKLQSIKVHMERINEKIHFLKNFIKDDKSQYQNNYLDLLNKILRISKNISSKYEAVNKKFSDKVEMAKKKIQMEIEEKSKSECNVQGGKLMQKLDIRIRMDLDRLRERQLDLEKITKISYQLLELSRDMRREADKQGRVISSIEDHITISNTKTSEANEELNKKRESQSSNNKLYFWIVTTLCVILMIVFAYLYFKYFRSPPNENLI